MPVRIGGFGGADGLAAHLLKEEISLLIDATHPFAARISANAAQAAAATGVPAFALHRPEWVPVAGDRWTIADGVAAALAGLGGRPRRVFVALGRQELEPLADHPQHAYVVRSVDPVDPPLPLRDVHYLLARGPFALEDEIAMLRDHHVDAILAKNSGGDATYAKLEAARRLGIEVVLVRRPPASGMQAVTTVDEAVAMVDHLLASFAERGE